MKYLYIGLTAFVAIMGGLFGGALDLMASEEFVAQIQALGYPAYFLLIIGIFKVLGGISLLVPSYEKLKEWTYAGFFFDFVGAAASHALNGDPVGKILPPLVFLVALLGSYALSLKHFRPLRFFEKSQTA